MLQRYFQKLNELVNTIEREEKDNLRRAAEKISECVQKNGIIHVFGCGHSHMLAEELFYRAGGLAAINPILVDELMLHQGALRSSKLEQTNDYAEGFMEHVNIRRDDVVVVVSTSGRNPVPIDVAEIASRKGAYTIAITSPEYAKSQSSRHKQGKYLYSSVDLAINNHIEVGDAMMTKSSFDVPFGSGSSIAGIAIANAIMVEATSIMLDNGYTPPVFKSGNADGAVEHNQKLINRYSSVIPMLTRNMNQE